MSRAVKPYVHSRNGNLHKVHIEREHFRFTFLCNTFFIDSTQRWGFKKVNWVFQQTLFNTSVILWLYQFPCQFCKSWWHILLEMYLHSEEAGFCVDQSQQSAERFLIGCVDTEHLP